jgi:hypothetical protein
MLFQPTATNFSARLTFQRSLIQIRYRGTWAKFHSLAHAVPYIAIFVEIMYASNYVKCHFPDVFCAANRRRCQKPWCEIRPVCINRSRWTVAGNEPGNRFPANRLPMLTVVMLSD